MFRLRRRAKLVVPISDSHSAKTLKRKPRCLTWTNVALGALIPLAIGVATVVLTIVNQKIDDKRRRHDEQLAYLRRVQDQQLADQLHYQGVYKTYVEDLSDILFKSNISFIDNGKKMKYIRTKTLTVLDELDWRHKSSLFFFLYETDLFSLPLEENKIRNVSLDLTGANLVNISIKSTPHKRFHFNNLHLLSVDLTNASFINCHFNQSADFSGSSMFGTKFTRSKFECSKTYTGYDDPFGEIHIKFDRSTLEKSDFTGAHICDTSFAQTNLAYSTLNRITFQGLIEFRGTNLTQVNLDQSFDNAHTVVPVSQNFFNIDFRTIPLSLKSLHDLTLGSFTINNVILLNGTWVANGTNLIRNGDAETNCVSLLNKHVPLNWEAIPPQDYPFPMLNKYSQLKNVSYGKCSFNFTVNDEEVSMYQDVDVVDYSVFIDSGNAEYIFSADIYCADGCVLVALYFYDIISAELNISNPCLRVNDTFMWHSINHRNKIPATTQVISVLLGRKEGGECFIDNMEFYIQRGT